MSPSTDRAAALAPRRPLHGGAPRGVHDRLRGATAAAHGEIDRALGFLLRRELDPLRYRALLAALYGFHAPLEARWRELRGADPPLPVAPPAAARLLARDLRALGLSPEAVRSLPRCAAVPAAGDVDRLAGWLYVVEGASLGGRVIARALERSLALDGETGAAFFSGDGEGAGARWRRVLSWLEARGGAGEGAAEGIAGGACDAFAALGEWLRERAVGEWPAPGRTAAEGRSDE